MQIIQDLSLSQLENIIIEMGEPKYRAKQIFENIYNGKNINNISNIPNDLKQKLKQLFIDEPVKIYTVQESHDGTQKFAYELFDGNIVEGVLMRYKHGNTLCVSCQVGCRMGCKFCASTLGGLVRNLTAGEILAQVLTVNAMLGGTAKKRQITNIVMMGSGEPLDNFENVAQFLKLVTSKDGINFSPRNISVSTCGIVPNIDKLAELGLPVILTISLHAPNDFIRKQIMPIANSYSIKQLIEASKRYFEKTGRRVVFEYALTDGINNTDECAKQLSKLIKGFPNHINLIPLNEVNERNLKSVTKKSCQHFANLLERYGMSVTIRRTMADDIDGACGQLRNKIINENKIVT